MLKLHNLFKVYQTDEVETVALNGVNRFDLVRLVHLEEIVKLQHGFPLVRFLNS